MAPSSKLQTNTQSARADGKKLSRHTLDRLLLSVFGWRGLPPEVVARLLERREERP